MPNILFFIVIPIIAAIVSVLLQLAYNAFPESWLQDYDFDPNSKDNRLARRMRFIPHTFTLTVFIVILHISGILFNPEIFIQRNIFQMFLMFLPIYPLALVVISDKLNRIIPDQLVVACIIFSLFGFAADLTYGNLWISSDSPFYFLLINRILGGLTGAFVLWLIAFIGALISGRDAMGQGDIKLLFACGLLTGGYGLIFTFFLAFLTGGIFAFPLLIKKRMRIAREEQRIRDSKNPRKERLILQMEKEKIGFADDPDYIAFGPFLAIGTVVFLIFETPIYQYYADTILPSLEYLF